MWPVVDRNQRQRLGWTFCWCRRRRLVSLVVMCVLSCLLFLYLSPSPAPLAPLLTASKLSHRSDPSKDGSHKNDHDVSTSSNHEDTSSSFKNYYNEQRRAGDIGNDSSRLKLGVDQNKNGLGGVKIGLQDDIVRINAAMQTISNKTVQIRDFQRQMMDVYSTQGDQRDYLFPPCQGKSSAHQASSMYGFIGPFRYLANYKNPCWMEQGQGDVPAVFCVPYFYLVGAPKAGSTDLFRRISMHPDVVHPASKETRWFDRARFAGKPHFTSFLNNFVTASGVISRSLERGTNYHKRIVGDGSPSYFFDNRNWSFMPGNEGCQEPRVTVASHIRHLSPQARIIFILRNPVDRLYSSYLYNHARYEAVSSRTFDMYVRDAITLYKDCFARYSLRQCANNATVFQQAKVMLIVSLYSAFIGDWIQLFPRDQLLFITTEQYNHNMAPHLHKIYDFLGLRKLSSTEMDPITSHTIYNKGNHYTKTGPMMPETRALLEDFYRPYNKQLASMLKNQEFLWMD